MVRFNQEVYSYLDTIVDFLQREENLYRISLPTHDIRELLESIEPNKNTYQRSYLSEVHSTDVPTHPSSDHASYPSSDDVPSAPYPSSDYTPHLVDDVQNYCISPIPYVIQTIPTFEPRQNIQIINQVNDQSNIGSGKPLERKKKKEKNEEKDKKKDEENNHIVARTFLGLASIGMIGLGTYFFSYHQGLQQNYEEYQNAISSLDKWLERNDGQSMKDGYLKDIIGNTQVILDQHYRDNLHSLYNNVGCIVGASCFALSAYLKSSFPMIPGGIAFTSCFISYCYKKGQSEREKSIAKSNMMRLRSSLLSYLRDPHLEKNEFNDYKDFYM